MRLTVLVEPSFLIIVKSVPFAFSSTSSTRPFVITLKGTFAVCPFPLVNVYAVVGY